MFTFKNSPKSTGLARVGEGSSCEIKLKKKQVGRIYGGSWNQDDFKVMFVIKDASEYCGWKWITFKARFDTFEAAKNFVKENYNAIVEKYDLHSFED